MKRFALAFAGALSLTMLFAPAEALARGHGGGHHGGGFHRMGGHGGNHHGGHHHGGRPHGGGFHTYGFGRPHFGRPHFGPRFGGYAYGWRGPRRVFVGGYPRPYPVYGAPRFGFNPGGCSVRRSVDFVPGGWRKIVTVRTCYVR